MLRGLGVTDWAEIRNFGVQNVQWQLMGNNHWGGPALDVSGPTSL